MATYKVNADGKAPSGLQVGDEVVTGGGTVKITGINADGSYQSTVSNKSQTTNNYTGSYVNAAANTASNTGNTTSTVTSPSGKTATYGETGVKQPTVNTDTYYSGNGASGTYKTPEDWAADTTDYASKMLAANSYSEFLQWANDRAQKAAAQGITLGSGSYSSNDDLYNQWVNSAVGKAALENDYQVYATMTNHGLLAGGGSIIAKDGYAIASDGKAIQVSNSQAGYDGLMPTAQRDTSRAGQTVLIGNWAVSYDENGYVTSRRNVGLDGLEKYSSYNYGGYGVNSIDDLYAATLNSGNGTTLPNTSYTNATLEALLNGTGAATPANTASSTAGTTAATANANSLAAYLEELYNQNLQAEIAGLTSAYDANVAELERQNDLIAEQFRAARNQSAAQNALETQQFQEYALAQGLNTGTSGQAALAQSAAYQGNLGNLWAQEAQAQADSDLQLAQLLSQYNSDVNQVTASINAQRAQAMYEEMVRQEELAYQQQLAAQQLAAQQQESAYTYAMTLLSAGVMPDASTLEAAGILSSEASALQTAILASNASSTKKSSTAGSTSSTGTTNTTGTTGTTGTSNTLSASDIATIQDALGVTADGIWGPKSQAAAKAAWGVTDVSDAYNAMISNGIGGKSLAEYEAAAGNYSSVKATLDSMKESGRSTAEILSALKDAYSSGALNTNDYMSLYNRYRG